MSGNDIVVVGAGRVGTALCRALVDSGRTVSGIVTRSPASARRAADLVPEVAQLTLEADLVTSAGTVLLCVADDDLAALVQLLSARLGPGQLVAHTSGRYGLAVLTGLPSHKAALHPVMTFTGGPADLANLRGIAYGVTADAAAAGAAAALVADLGGVVEVVPEDRRAGYHAALCHAANHLVTLIADAADLLRAAGVEDTSLLLGPITRATLANVLAVDPMTGRPAGDAALTGPVVRGDVGTVAAHLAALAGEPAQGAYRAMAKRTAERAAAAGRLGQQAAEEIVALLERGLPGSDGTEKRWHR